MLESTFNALQQFFSYIWALFASWYLPGTRVTPAVIFMLFLGVWLIIYITRRLFSSDD